MKGELYSAIFVDIFLFSISEEQMVLLKSFSLLMTQEVK